MSAAGGVRAAAFRMVWVLADQGVSSISNVLVSLTVLHGFSTRDVGGYGVAFAIYVIILNVDRSLACESYAIHYAHEHTNRARRARGKVTGLAFVIGCIGGLVGIAISSIMGGPVGEALLAMSVAMPLLIVQDAHRFVFFANGRGSSAAINDSVWLVLQILATWWTWEHYRHSLFAIVAAWSLTGAIAGVVAIYQLGILPRPTKAWQWVMENRSTSPRFLAEYALAGGSVQGAILAITAVGGLVVVGLIRVVQVLTGPVYLFFQGGSAFMIPEAVSIGRKSIAKLRIFAFASSALLALLGILGTCSWLLVPDRIGIKVAGHSWNAAKPLIFPYAFFVAADGVVLGARAALRSTKNASRSLRSRAMAAPFIIAGGVVGVSVNGALGGVIGLAAGNCVAAAIWLLQAHLELKSKLAEGPEPLDDAELATDIALEGS